MASSPPAQSINVVSVCRRVSYLMFKRLASLKLTVTLFALSIFLILVGTLAQVDNDIWKVMQDYFTAWFIWVPATILLPAPWIEPVFPDLTPAHAARGLGLAFAGITLLTAGLTFVNVTKPETRYTATGVILMIGLFFSAFTAIYEYLPFVGGATIGVLMLMNLFAAHLLRFKIQARGTKLACGIITTAIGVALTITIIMLGHDSEGGIQGEPPFKWTTLWSICKSVLTVISTLMFLNWFRPTPDSSKNKTLRTFVGITGLAAGILSIWLWAGDEKSTYLGDSGMRVLWQLIQSTVAGLVLLAGLYLLFKKRAGVVELHLGVILMMFGQWFVNTYDIEQQIDLAEGETKSHAHDIRSVELAVISEAPNDASQEDVVVFPLSKNGKKTNFVKDDQPISSELPFEIELVNYFSNSHVESLKGKAPPVANAAGDAESWVATEVAPVSGTGDGVNMASAYVKITKDDKDFGTLLVSQIQLVTNSGMTVPFDAEQVEIDGKKYDLQLRFKRIYKPYSVTLIDVRREDYLGTSKPRHYASTVHIKDKKGTDHESNIWMNNPLRFAGETFYQQNFAQDTRGNEYSTLQVVLNQGWMIPYVSCMICAVGMFFHFLNILQRFLNRSEAGAALQKLGMYSGGAGLAALLVAAVRYGIKRHAESKEAKKSTKTFQPNLEEPVDVRLLLSRLTPVVVVILAAALFGYQLRPSDTTHAEMNLSEFGRLPIAYQGRIKPLDTLARNSIKFLSSKESFQCRMSPVELKDHWDEVSEQLGKAWPDLKGIELTDFQDDNKRSTVQGLIEHVEKNIDPSQVATESKVADKIHEFASIRQPAIRWLLDFICATNGFTEQRIIRITSLELLETLELKRRKGFLYSIEEILPKIPTIQEEDFAARKQNEKNPRKLTLYQKKVMALSRKIAYIGMIRQSFEREPLPRGNASEIQAQLASRIQRLKSMEIPLVVPPTDKTSPDGLWQSYPMASLFQAIFEMEGTTDTPFRQFEAMLFAYANLDAENFDKSVAEYREFLEQHPPKELIAKTSITNSLVTNIFGNFYRFEEYFSRTAPFLWSAAFYVLAFTLLTFGWLFRAPSLGRSAYALLCFTFLIHTLALIARIYLSGRPPVTNLYSSAVFIGWSGVGLFLVGERLQKTGMLSAVASAVGFGSLLIAYLLALDGDTFEVLQAVLDTQFWLATHVVCISFGYTTTFLAGGLGTIYLLRGMLTPGLDKNSGKELARMIYGTLCFAILFSFVGTVLGGLWADDSWGRFWGWDPKENGALIIVLWNALVLHARWDGLIKERGLAVLAIAGNIVTAWSWFGVNELGVGLHSYGFTEGRLRVLTLYVGSQLSLIVLGCLPLQLWWSHRRNQQAAT